MILYVQCGLGNQMFQYAFLKYMEARGYKNIRIDSSAPSMNRHNGFELRRVFPVIDCRGGFLSYAQGRALHLLSDILKKGFGYNLETDALDGVVPKGKMWLRGYWQDARYAESVRDELLRHFEFLKIEDDKNKRIAQMIEQSNSVSIHVRRGDYLSPGDRIFFGDICTQQYYTEAIEQIRARVDNPKFFVFSNDMVWVKANFGLDDAVYIEHNSAEQSFRDMQLMSLCKHNIVANSSFSWWGAWLNNKPNSVIVSPAKWMHNCPADFSHNIIPENWVKVGAFTPNVTLRCSGTIPDNQIYKDYEVITDAKVRGNHIFDIDEQEIKCFEDPKYLQRKLTEYFKNE